MWYLMTLKTLTTQRTLKALRRKGARRMCLHEEGRECKKCQINLHFAYILQNPYPLYLRHLQKIMAEGVNMARICVQP